LRCSPPTLVSGQTLAYQVVFADHLAWVLDQRDQMSRRRGGPASRTGFRLPVRAVGQSEGEGPTRPQRSSEVVSCSATTLRRVNVDRPSELDLIRPQGDAAPIRRMHRVHRIMPRQGYAGNLRRCRKPRTEAPDDPKDHNHAGRLRSLVGTASPPADRRFPSLR